ncbi:YecA family protein [Bradyrhizobium septentrionale]
MSPRRHKAASSMPSAAMPLADLERWLQARIDRHPAATSIPMLDGYAAAIVAGPVSMSPLDWICPLLAIDADAFNHGGTPEFAAISAVALRHNDISNTLSTAPDRFEPIHRRNPNGDVDPRPWCQGFHAAMRLRLSAWAPMLDTSNVNHGLLLPILLHCRDDQGQPMLGSPRSGRETADFLRNAYADIPAVVEAMRQYWMPIRYPRAR